MRLLTTALAASFLFLCAAAPPAQPLSPQDSALAETARAYLQGLTNAKARFAQTDARGATSQGTFYLQRPGKARFDYDPPSGLVIASDGHKVSVFNRRLKTLQSYPLGLTPLSLFLAKQIRLDRGVMVTRVTRTPGGFTVTAKDARKKTQGQIALTFAETPIALTGWIVTDPQGAAVRVRLEGLGPAPAHDPTFFDIWRPRIRAESGG